MGGRGRRARRTVRPRAKPSRAAWRELVDACARPSPESLEAEHTTLFIGTGKAEVTPYLSYYVLRHTSDVPLVELRPQLAQWGLARPPTSRKTTSPVSAKRCALLLRCSTARSEEQKAFFHRFLYPAAMPFCDCGKRFDEPRLFTGTSAEFARCFLSIEKDAFEMLG